MIFKYDFGYTFITSMRSILLPFQCNNFRPLVLSREHMHAGRESHANTKPVDGEFFRFLKRVAGRDTGLWTVLNVV